MGIGMAVPSPCNTKQNKANSNQSGFAGKSHSFNPRGSPDVSIQTGYSSHQTGSAFPLLLQTCVVKGKMAPKAFTYIMELHLIGLLWSTLRTTGWKVLQNCTYIWSLTAAVAMWLYNFLRGFKHGWNHNSLQKLYLLSFSQFHDKLCKCFPWSFGLLFI